MKQNIFFCEWKKNFYNKSVKNSQFKIKTNTLSQENFESCLPSEEQNSNQKLTEKANLISLKNRHNIPTKIVYSSKKELNSSLTRMQYNLQTYNRSNQDTCMFHRPAVSEGQWVQKGDLLADCSASIGGELALGQNIFVAYMPWEGYNYEDAILISQRLVYDDIYTSIHIERYEIETRETKFGVEEITRQIPEIDKSELFHLDKRGIIKIGTWVEEGTILVGKVTPTNKKYHSPYQKLLYTILEKEFLPTRDTSLRAPKGLKAKVIDIQVINTEVHSVFFPLVHTSQQAKVNNDAQVQSNLIEKHNKLGSYFATKEAKITEKQYKKESSSYRKWFMFSSFNQNFLQPQMGSYLPTSVHNSKQEKQTLKSDVFKKLNNNLNRNIASLVDMSKKQNTFMLKKSQYEPIVAMKHKPVNEKRNTKTNLSLTIVSVDQSPFPLTLNKSEAYSVTKQNPLSSMEYFSTGVRSKIKSELNSKKLLSMSANKQSIQGVHIYLAEKRKIQMGDKMAGRHGNKGIVSQVLPRQDMPYLPDGTPIDMVLNPLGVPSRMNVGQIYECLLGLAGKYLGEYFRIAPFDEIYGAEASRSLVYSKLYEVRKKTGSKWIFNPNNPGKMYLYDGRTGESFDQAITVGQAYMLKLVHLVDDKIHARSTGPYSLVTQQPLRGRSKQGGQRLGEMEVWALEGYGAAFTLLEMLTIKSDDMTGRITLWSNIILNKEIYIGTPESFKVLVCELQALCLDIGLFRFDSKGFLKQVEHLMKLP
jgi:DNA-directed RNA polymerase subunit beta